MKLLRFAAILLCGALLAGCGKEEPETEVFYDIETEEEELVFGGSFLGLQFLQGEPVMLVERLNSYVEEVMERDIYLCRTDGSRELLVQGAVGHPLDSGWYVDNEQAVYYVDGAVSDKSTLVKCYPQGRKTYRIDLGAKLVDIRQAADGRIYLLLQKGGSAPMWLEELDAAAGKTVKAGGDLELSMDTVCLGTGAEGLFTMRVSPLEPVFMKVGLKEGSEDTFLTSAGTSYMGEKVKEYLSIRDFQVLEDGSVEVLWGGINAHGKGILERLKEVQVEKIPLTVRASVHNDYWLKQQASRFNRENEKYHVVLEECGVEHSWDTVTKQQSFEDYAEMTSIQMATGKGPDILYGNVLRDYAAGLAEKGGFEDLAPYMESSGIREEDYYPLTFSAWRDGEKIYSVRTDAVVREYLMDGAVLGTGREPGSIEELTDALLTWQGNEIFLEGMDQTELLELFLRGTEDIWEMIDWEQGTCDFGRELFGKLLETAKRYGDDGSGKRAPLAVQHAVGDKYLLMFVSSSDREEEGLVRAGVLFEDGCHATAKSFNMMMVNANSDNKEGAWEFIRFLLSEEAQSSVSPVSLTRNPVYKGAFAALVEDERAQVKDGKKVPVGTFEWVDGEKVIVTTQYGEDRLAEERLDEYVAMIEDARELPVRTRPIIEIICEEAGGYFAGSKSVEETAAVVKNRVQVYLDENFSRK